MTASTLEQPQNYRGLVEAPVETVSRSEGYAFYAGGGVQRQVERLRQVRLETASHVLQLGVLLESNRCDFGDKIVVAYSVPEAAKVLGIPVEKHSQDPTRWLVPGTGYSVRYGESMTGTGHEVEVAVRLHPERGVEVFDMGMLAPEDLVTLTQSKNGITAYKVSDLQFHAATRGKYDKNAKVRARCEVEDAHDGDGLELLVKIPKSRMR